MLARVGDTVWGAHRDAVMPRMLGAPVDLKATPILIVTWSDRMLCR